MLRSMGVWRDVSSLVAIRAISSIQIWQSFVILLGRCVDVSCLANQSGTKSTCHPLQEECRECDFAVMGSRPKHSLSTLERAQLRTSQIPGGSTQSYIVYTRGLLRGRTCTIYLVHLYQDVFQPQRRMFGIGRKRTRTNGNLSIGPNGERRQQIKCVASRCHRRCHY